MPIFTLTSRVSVYLKHAEIRRQFLLTNISSKIRWQPVHVDLFLQYYNQHVLSSFHHSVVYDHKRFHSPLVFQEVSKSVKAIEIFKPIKQLPQTIEFWQNPDSIDEEEQNKFCQKIAPNGNWTQDLVIINLMLYCDCCAGDL